MRRSKDGPAPSARGNFTPPSRATVPAQAAAPEQAATPPSGGGRFSPRNWRVRTRLNAILLIPVAVGLVMAGVEVKSSVNTWQQAEDSASTARIVQTALTYGDALLRERDETAAPLLAGKGPKDKAVVAAYARTDKAAAAYHDAIRQVPDRPSLQRRIDVFAKMEPKLAPLRKAAYSSALHSTAVGEMGIETERSYVGIAHPLQDFANELNTTKGNVTSYGRMAYALSLAKASLSLERSIGMHLLVKPGPGDGQLSSQRINLISYAYLENIAVEEYNGAGTQADQDRLEANERQVTADAKELARKQTAKDPSYVPPPSDPSTLVSALGTLSSTDPSARAALAKQGITAENWWGLTTLKYNVYRQMEADFAQKSVNEASAMADDARTSAIITAAAVLLALLLAFVLAALVARQMSRAMRQLRGAAFGIAEQRLPMLVDQLSRTDPGQVDTHVQPIPIHTTDEIGEVARAFDQVHREAVRLAAEQALLRGNINAIFTNLSRRNQSLIEGQLTLITDLENNEADPDQLENLFKLDHLATRMRRNGENLLVLAGEEPGRRWDQPVPLVDVLRAASSEVEQYERIELSGVPDAEIHGRAVTDLVHLLAELLENATTFSSPQTKVRVTATRLPDGRIMVEIHDKGIGLTPEDFADINHKLANPPTVDAAISRHMGLFVVGRLSDRHGIRVQLRPSGEQAGTTSLVMLPDAITHGGGGQAQQPDEFTVSQMIPRPSFPGASESTASRTAAELGFDDTRYGHSPDGVRGLDPVGRSRLREERRAALEAQAHQEALETGPSGGYDAGGDGQDYGYDQGQGQNSYQEQQAAYDQSSGYDQQQAYAGNGGQAYGDGYYAHDGNAPQGDGYQADGGYDRNGYAEAQAGDAGMGAYQGYDAQSYQGDWQQQNGYQGTNGNGYAQEAESGHGADGSGQGGVGFDRPGPADSAAPSLTDAGLPRRGASPNGMGGLPRRNQGASASGSNGAAGNGASGNGSGDDNWRSANDERWQTASGLRRPKAGGVTSSGLPRRVPKANLVEGTAEATPQGGPQVSRDPDEVRGRLSNLRRGVQRGRNAGSETNGQANRNQHGGPDSTYNQER